MGERYDAMVTLGDGVFPLVALAEGKNELARALVRTASGRIPGAGLRPAELDRQIGVIDMFTSTPQARLAARKPDTTLTAALGGDMNTYVWTINGRTYDNPEPFQVAQGQRVRLVMRNDSMMWHPMHLHGHTFQIVRPDGAGPRKDTAIVRPAQTVAVDLDADNPGAWMFHCHNEYHLDAGMMTRVDYRL
jgi:FtsP/CotA-like multicopper oxidase with cupredoxin domain